MNLSAAAAQAIADFVDFGIKDEADAAGQCPTTRSRLRAWASGCQLKAPVSRRARCQVRDSQNALTSRSPLSAGPPVHRPPA